MKIAKMPDGSPELYLAFQGEGKTLGKPIVFVRNSICNLSCSFCDSYYTWDFEGTPWAHDWAGKVNQVLVQIEVTPKEIADKMIEVGGHIKAAVLTGGEPTLQQKDLIEVMSYLPDWYFEIETNGTILLQEEFYKRISQINCSPKLVSSGTDDGKSINNNRKIRNRPEVIEQFKMLKQNGTCDICFKFVVKKETIEQDMLEIKEWQQEHNIPNEWIFLMSEGIEVERIINGTRDLAEICKKEGYNLTTRLQIILYGNKRAV